MALNPEQAEYVRKKLLEQVSKLPEDQQDHIREQIKSATPEQLEAYIKPAPGEDSTQGSECLFCGIVQGKVETYKIYENNFVIAFLDINPAAPGQVIVATKEHIGEISKVQDQALWESIKLVKALNPIIKEVASAKGISTYFAQGKDAGQIMDHFYINIIPRFEKDKAAFAWERQEADKKDLEAASKKIIGALNKSLISEREKIESKIREEVKASEAQKPENLPKLKERRP